MTYLCQSHKSYLQYFPLQCSFNCNVETQNLLSSYVFQLLSFICHLIFSWLVYKRDLSSSSQHEVLHSLDSCLTQLPVIQKSSFLTKIFLPSPGGQVKFLQFYFTMILIKVNHQDLVTQKKVKGFSCACLQKPKGKHRSEVTMWLLCSVLFQKRLDQTS